MWSPLGLTSLLSEYFLCVHPVTGSAAFQGCFYVFLGNVASLANLDCVIRPSNSEGQALASEELKTLLGHGPQEAGDDTAGEIRRYVRV